MTHPKQYVRTSMIFEQGPLTLSPHLAPSTSGLKVSNPTPQPSGQDSGDRVTGDEPRRTLFMSDPGSVYWFPVLQLEIRAVRLLVLPSLKTDGMDLAQDRQAFVLEILRSLEGIF